jgi:iron complex outermembrane recepter protein
MKALKIKFITLGACFVVFISSTKAQFNPDSISMKFDLGEVVVHSNKLIRTGATTNAETINQTEKDNVADALNLIPGVLNSQGAKEDMVYVRGFNLRQVPIYFDGIPIALPYDGFFDLDMMLAGSISEISVVSGTDAMLFGPNALGGAINIISARPKEGFSGLLKAGTYTNGNYQASASLGYSTKKYYTLVNFTRVDREDYRLSDDYIPLSSIEDGGNLANSYKKNSQLDAKFVFTPAEGSEYAFAYAGNWGQKGIPPYLGTNGTPRFWQFPQYDKHSIYFLSKTKLSKNSFLKTRMYFDKFDDNLKSYDDSTYSTMDKRYAFSSFYDDYNVGGIATYTFLTETNSLNADFQYRNENHKEFNEGETVVGMIDQIMSFSIVNYYYFEKFTFSGGVSVQNMKSSKAQYMDENDALVDFPDNKTTAYNGEFGLKYQIDNSNTIKLGLAYKTRFPTMKDRYSQRFGRSLPNPGLKEEYALNYTIDYTGIISNKVFAKVGLYYSNLKDAIAEVYGIDTASPNVYQLQNVAKAEYYGGEASVECKIIKPLSLQVNYAYVVRNNLSSPEVKFTGVPTHTIQGALIYRYKKRSYLNVNFENYSDRIVTSNGDKVDSYFLVNAKAAYAFLKESLVLEAGINNILDNAYQISEGYPMPGRNMFVSAVYHF